MLTNTFCHIPGVGAGTEQKFWDAGIFSWEDALSAVNFPGRRPKKLEEMLEESQERLASKDALWFAERMPANQHWRLLPHFMDSVVSVDIETTGLSYPEAEITTIAICDGSEVRTYVQGRNLQDAVEDMMQYSLLVTFNGKCFDIPFIEQSFGVRIQQAHLDLRYPFKTVGLSGGLKRIERKLGFSRDELDGVDGFMAVLLWNEYCVTRDEQVLETLLAYNAEDVITLHPLAVWVYNEHLTNTPFVHSKTIAAKPLVVNPHKASTTILRRMLSKV